MKKDKYNSLLSQTEIEHNTYTKVLNDYNNMKESQQKVNRTGIIFILVSAVIFLFLMFSLESKIIFLNLWIVTILFTVAFLIRNEYRIYKLRLYLGFEDEEDDEKEIDNEKTDISRADSLKEKEKPLKKSIDENKEKSEIQENKSEVKK